MNPRERDWYVLGMTAGLILLGLALVIALVTA